MIKNSSICFVLIFGCLLSTSAQTTMIKFTDTFKLYTLSYPSSFQFKKLSLGVSSWIGPLSSSNDTYQEMLKIELRTVQDNMTIDSIVPILLQAITSSLTTGGKLSHQDVPIEIDGQKGRELSTSGIIKGEKELVNISVKMLIRNKLLYTILVVEPYMDKVTSLGKKTAITEIVDSFRFN